MTDLELTRRALLLLYAGSVGPSPWLDAEAEVGLAIPYAEQALANEIAGDPKRFGLLQQTYSVPLTAGVGDLLAATGSLTALADILWGSIRSGQVKDADGNRLVYVAERPEFEGYLLPGFKYYTLTHQRLTARSAVSGDYSSDLGDVTSPLVVTANWIPTTANLPAQLDDDLVRTLARIVTEKIAPPK